MENITAEQIMKFAMENPVIAVELFNRAIAKSPSAKVEVTREYCCNEDFRAKLESYIYNKTR